MNYLQYDSYCILYDSFNLFDDPSSDPMSTNTKVMNSYINFFAISEESAFEIIGILTLTQKREGVTAGNLLNDRGIRKKEVEDEQKLFCLFERYLSSILDKQRTLHFIYAGLVILSSYNMNHIVWPMIQFFLHF